ncbi:hypothetical protein AUP68_03151 [Ilyonectria robusta]
MDPEDLSLTGDAGSDDGDTIKDVLEGAGGVGPFDSHDEDSPDDHPTPIEMSNGTVTNRYREIMQQQHLDSSDVSSLAGSDVHGLPKRAGSPMESLMSGPDDSPSIQGSFISSPGSSVLPSVASRPGLSSPTPSFRPFDRRFQSRISSPGIHTPRSASPAFLATHSRNVSLSSQFFLDQADTDTQTPPWEVVRWTRLRKLNGQAFSEMIIGPGTKCELHGGSESARADLSKLSNAVQSLQLLYLPITQQSPEDMRMVTSLPGTRTERQDRS